VARALARIDTADAREQIVTLLRDTDVAVRLQAVRALGKVGSMDALGSIEPLLEDHGTVFDTSISEEARKANRAIKQRVRRADRRSVFSRLTGVTGAVRKEYT
jgi:HEAT repeat protein